MSLEIVRTHVAHFEGLYTAIDEVARERRYLAFFQAPPVEAAFGFFRSIVENDQCQFVALDGRAVIGWCDILPKPWDACAHVGALGMGVVRAARRRGAGTRLLTAAIDCAESKGLSRIELAVRADNRDAIGLYTRFGFALEGMSRRAYRVDGQFVDVATMARLT
ncbi:GNAT family N-acetyltransferase [Sphaerotilus uruguayifluvii]|uniref:Acetyltransferase n=1 Tax=Sphaerotilus uruguayifluvii TaxID=2735897 RepID=A0ABX2G9Q3_9BURK|nr:GNAT family N-acetyltransferase [Leptothrix sp. C29]NRT58223.1 putative acetyltransferase [Leptothrix sp. C29]